MKKIIYFLSLILIFLVVLFFSTKKPAIIYSSGNDHNFISLAPNITEAIYWLGAENSLIGVTSDCNYPKEAKKITPTGKYTFPDLEKIVLLQPAAVLCEKNADQRFLKKLTARQIEYHLLDLKNISVFFNELRKLNKILGTARSAQIDQLEKQYQTLEPLPGKTKILILLWQKPYIIAGQNTYLSEALAKIGLLNAAQKTSYYSINEEFFYKQQIDCLINLSGKPLNLKINSKIIEDLDNDIMLRLSPRLIEYLPVLKNKFIIN